MVKQLNLFIDLWQNGWLVHIYLSQNINLSLRSEPRVKQSSVTMPPPINIYSLKCLHIYPPSQPHPLIQMDYDLSMTIVVCPWFMLHVLMYVGCPWFIPEHVHVGKRYRDNIICLGHSRMSSDQYSIHDSPEKTM